ncbi:MAG: hypothetical protein DBY36_01950 [Clostridiales bacterium]|nr:MAG: hypothetical protein DBY36_01950 [Clostridiales bacterium]
MKNTIGVVLAVLGGLGYLALHIYFVVIAFQTYTTWFAIVTIIPGIGPLMFSGAQIGDGNWIPALLYVAVLALEGIANKMMD